MSEDAEIVMAATMEIEDAAAWAASPWLPPYPAGTLLRIDARVERLTREQFEGYVARKYPGAAVRKVVMGETVLE